MHKIFYTILALVSYAASQGVLGPPFVICEYDQGKTSLTNASITSQRCDEIYSHGQSQKI